MMMQIYLRAGLFWMLAAGAALLLGASPAQAYDIVLDPTNLAQNVLQAARALQQIDNQIQEIEQQTRMLAHSPLQMSGALGQSVNSARQLFANAQGLAFEIDRIGDDLKTLYPETWDKYDLGQALKRSDQWIAESRSSLETAMRAEAQAASSVGAARGRIEAALSASADAEGQTGAVQAGNQLLGQSAAQLADIEALLAAQGRALETEKVESLARETRADEIERRAFPTTYPAPAPARSAF
jgi:P-type conjugative transfer protein TrbJ